jgi:predicted enzyme related to lactoylglutathione lyase
MTETVMGKVVHFEIPFDNKERAMKFYAECFGWQLMDMPQMNYVLATTAAVDDRQMPREPGAINGGMIQRSQAAAHPVLYVGVQSIDATIGEVTARGGKVVTPKTPIPDMGAYARVTDPEGNVIGLFQGL